jgi:hypothetical protein
MATCGTMNWLAISRTATTGKSTGSRVSSSARVQSCSLSEMVVFSWPLRIISAALSSSPLIFPRNISA